MALVRLDAQAEDVGEELTEATLFCAGTMVWSKRIVMAHLQCLVFSMFGLYGDLVLVMPMSGLPHDEARPVPVSDNREGMGKGLQGRDVGHCGQLGR